MICRECGEYLDLIDEGEDPQGRLYDLYICIECGYQCAVPQPGAAAGQGGMRPAYPEWDPPDGTRSSR